MFNRKHLEKASPLRRFAMGLALFAGLTGAAWALSQQEVVVSDKSDDAEERVAGGAVDIGSSDLELVDEKPNAPASRQLVGIRFRGLNILPGSIIKRAWIQFECDEARPKAPPAATLRIHAQAASDAPAVKAQPRDVSSRPRTQASVAWRPAPWTVVGQAGPNQRTPDLSAIVQEIVNRPDWAGGNAMVFIIDGEGWRCARANGATRLCIESEFTGCNIGFAQAASVVSKGGAPGRFEVRLSRRVPPGATLRVDYQVTPAAGGVSPGSGTLALGAGEDSASIALKVAANAAQEDDERFVIRLSNPRIEGASLKLALAGITEHACTIQASDIPDDWPMWRFNARHTAATPHALPPALGLQWALELGRPEPAWPWTQDKLQFDATYEPVVLGKTIFVPSTRTDSITAYDIDSGRLRWRFFAEGPVRMAPVAGRGRVWFGSDDGCLYCLDAASGALIWKHRAVPSSHKTLGNERIVSTWPLRGGPVLHAGRIYFAASIWPAMGIYIYALDADTGKVVWLNSGEGMVWQDQQHATVAKSFAGIAPQGCLAVAGDRLLVPSGRAVPGAFDLASGRFLYARLSDRTLNKDQGGCAVAVMGDRFFCGPGHNRPAEFGNTPGMYSLADGKTIRKTRAAVLTPQAAYEAGEGVIKALRLDSRDLKVQWSLAAPGCTEVFCKAGARLYAGGKGKIVAIDDTGAAGAVAWEKPIAGVPASCLAAGGKLFVVTLEGTLYCFGEGADRAAPPAPPAPAAPRKPAEDRWTAEARRMLDASGERDGYCFVTGVESGRLMEELVRQSNLRVIGLTPDAALAQRLRARWADQGLPFSRISILTGDLETAQLPPYVANLIVSETALQGPGLKKHLERVFRSLRPYGGKACFAPELQAEAQRAATEAKLANAQVRQAGAWTMLERAGALPGSGSWTHNYSDAANTVFSRDKLVKAPLGILWYGGNDHLNVLPRHGHGPTEQIIGGRMFIEGPGHLTGRDVYTGRVLWERELPGLGQYFDNTSHEAGANHMGSNYASAADGVYVAYGPGALWLDPATGQTITTFTLNAPGRPALEFAQIRLAGDLMVVAADPHSYDDRKPGVTKSWNRTGSKVLLAMDRRTGQVLWSRPAVNLFHHNSIIIGGDTVFAIDRLAPSYEAQRARRGQDPVPYTLLALDLHSGEVKWTVEKDVFGSWLGYSAEHGVLIQSGRRSRDMAIGEPGDRIIAHNAANGKTLWDRQTGVSDGPYIIFHDMLIMQDSGNGWGIELLTGKDVLRPNPLTGLPERWQFKRRYGCNTAIASENLLTFRSGAIGYYDMTTLAGTANFGGAKSGCTPNLIAADGILSAPDYTRTCLCAYQNQCSLALIHMPEVETWTYGGWAAPATTSSLSRVGINLGAIGDRAADSGTLWLDFPSIGFDSPDPPVTVEPAATRYFRQHSALFGAGPTDWITASGAIGLRRLSVALGNAAPRPYTVRLFFAEPEQAAPGQRVFNVAIQGRPALAGFDVAKEAGSGGQGVAREFKGVMARDRLELTLDPAPGAPLQEPVLCGVELVAEQ